MHGSRNTVANNTRGAPSPASDAYIFDYGSSDIVVNNTFHHWRMMNTTNETLLDNVMRGLADHGGKSNVVEGNVAGYAILGWAGTDNTIEGNVVSGGMEIDSDAQGNRILNNTASRIRVQDGVAHNTVASNNETGFITISSSAKYAATLPHVPLTPRAPSSPSENILANNTGGHLNVDFRSNSNTVAGNEADYLTLDSGTSFNRLMENVMLAAPGPAPSVTLKSAAHNDVCAEPCAAACPPHSAHDRRCLAT